MSGRGSSRGWMRKPPDRRERICLVLRGLEPAAVPVWELVMSHMVPIPLWPKLSTPAGLYWEKKPRVVDIERKPGGSHAERRRSGFAPWIRPRITVYCARLIVFTIKPQHKMEKPRRDAVHTLSKQSTGFMMRLFVLSINHTYDFG